MQPGQETEPRKPWGVGAAKRNQHSMTGEATPGWRGDEDEEARAGSGSEDWVRLVQEGCEADWSAKVSPAPGLPSSFCS